MDGMWIPIIATLSLFGLFPGIIFYFIYKSKKARYEIDALRYKKEIAELETLKEETKIRRLEAENKMLDRNIESNINEK